MSTIQSADGTSIAYERTGEGPPLILVDGALCYRASGPSGPLADRLRKHFTVYRYDRRGRGESGDTARWALEREVEDLAALVEVAGGSAAVYGISSGAALALEAARRGVPIAALALYEAPFIVDDTRAPAPPDFAGRLQAMVAAGRRGDAVRSFMRFVGVPRVLVAVMRVLPMWSKLTGIAHTLPYDASIVGGDQLGKPLDATRWAGVEVPTLVLDGGKSPDWMRNAARALADAVPGARHQTLPGQTHVVSPKALAPPLMEYFDTVGNLKCLASPGLSSSAA
jgi:pimeloyl-ACP methyl ester carboxylesterase